MEDIIKKNGPIGPVVKQADKVFSHLVRKTKMHGSFNRIDWQLLLFLKEKTKASKPEIRNYLYALEEKESEIEKTLNRFIMQGLVSETHEGFILTVEGKQVFVEVAKEQDEIKEKALKGIDEEAYTLTMETLQKITLNLMEFLPEENQ